MNRMNIRKCMVSGIVCCLLGMTAVVSAVQEGVVFANNLIIRAKPAGYFERIGQLTYGEKVSIVSQKMDWLEIYLPAGRTRGWVSKLHIDENGAVISEVCDLHSGPGKVFTSFYRARKGEQLKLVKEVGQDRWCQVEAPAKATGWVAENFIKVGEEAQALLAQSEKNKTTAAAEKAPAELKELSGEKTAVDKEFVARRAAIKAEHAQELSNLSRETGRLNQLKAEADKLQKETADRKKQLETLKIESERMQALKAAAEAKVALAKSEGEKANLLFRQEQDRLLKLKAEAEYKARTVLAEREKWEAEAVKTAKALQDARSKAKLDAQMAENEARTLKDAEKKAVLEAELALKRTMDAEKQQKMTDAKFKEISKAVKELQQEVDVAGKKVEILRLEREKMTASAKEENAKLLMMKAEAERIALEQKSLALKIEQYKKESEILNAEAEKQAAIVSQKKKDVEQKKAEATAMQEKKQTAVSKAEPKQEKTEVSVKQEKNEVRITEDEKKSPVVKTEHRAASRKTRSSAVSVVKKKAPAGDKVQAKSADKKQVEDKKTAKPEKQKPVVAQKKSQEKSQPAEKKWDGVVVSLGSRGSVFATHVLCIRRQYSLTPVCYLRSSSIDLRDWENSDVRIMGDEHTLPNWTRPIIEVRGIMKNSARK